MRTICFSLGFFVAITFGLACKTQTKPSTDFFRQFRFAELVEKAKVTELQPMTGGGEFSEAFQGSSASRRRSFDLMYRINDAPGRSFDEESLLGRLKDEIVGKLRDNDIQPDEVFLSERSIYAAYTKSSNRGWIGISAVLFKDGTLKLWGVAEETSGSE